MKTVTSIIYLAFALIAFASSAETLCWEDSDGFEICAQVDRNARPSRRLIGDFSGIEFWEHGNSAIGPDALKNATGTGDFNTAVGVEAMEETRTGSRNTAVGYQSLNKNVGGNRNTAVGDEALFLNTTGDQNTATGSGALKENHTGVGNVADGARALANNNANYNTAVGSDALFSNTIGRDNTATGFHALANNNANYNTAVGSNVLFSNTTGDRNTASGRQALFSNTIGRDNTATGFDALKNNTTGPNNTATGAFALDRNTTGTGNTALGVDAGTNVTGGSYNTVLGFAAGSAILTANNVIAIGNNVSGENVSNTCYIGNIFGATSPMGTAVYVNSLGKLGTVVSSSRFKDEIQPMDKASEAILALKPVTFRYKQEIDPAGTSQFGLVAEDVEKVNPDLVVRDGEGKLNTVRYEAVNAMLLNEFLKEYRKVQELEANDAEQQREIKALVATVKEQAAQIQRVSAQLEASKPAPQVVNNQ